MVEKTKIVKKCTPTNAKAGYIILMAITRQKIELESCSNNLKTGKIM